MKKIILISTLIVSVLSCQGLQDEYVNNEMQRIENKVAVDAVEQYNIAKESGSDMDAYTQASLAAAAFLQAKDKENYQKWKEIEEQEAENIGLSEMP